MHLERAETFVNTFSVVTWAVQHHADFNTEATENTEDTEEQVKGLDEWMGGLNKCVDLSGSSSSFPIERRYVRRVHGECRR